MERALRLRTTVLPGGKIEIADPQFLPGESVEVIVLAPQLPAVRYRSATDILAEAKGRRVFRTAEEVDAYLQAERDSWD